MTYLPVHGLSGYDEIVEEILRSGTVTHPRGMETRDLSPAVLRLDKPRDRLVTAPWRKMNPAFAFTEWLMIMAGDDSTERIAFYAERMKQFSSDGVHIDGAYGPLVQPYLNSVVAKLIKDGDSRQAAISIFSSADSDGANVPCTLAVQARVNKGKLDMFTYMRSNDVVWGLTYDAFCWTMLQEWLAVNLGIEVGVYWHMATSLHLYVERDAKMLEARAMSPVPSVMAASEMSPMKSRTWANGVPVKMLDDAERYAAAGQYEVAMRVADKLEGSFWCDWVHVLVAWSMKKHGVDARTRRMVVDSITSRQLRAMLTE